MKFFPDEPGEMWKMRMAHSRIKNMPNGPGKDRARAGFKKQMDIAGILMLVQLGIILGGLIGLIVFVITLMFK